MKQKKIIIDDVEYTLQKVMPLEWLRIRERCKNKHGLPIDENLYREILEHIVIAPKKTINDFDEVEVLEELMKEAITFQCKKTSENTEPIQKNSKR
jgi:hypothetical protein